MPPQNLETARLHREWLRALVRTLGISPTKIAKQAGLTTSTVTRPLNDGDEGQSTLHANTIAKIVARFGVEPPGAVPQDGQRRPALGVLREEAEPFITEDRGLSAAVAALVRGRNNAVPWRLKTRALEGAGFLVGDVVVLDLNETPRAGDAVCAQVYDWRGGTAETVWRLYDPPVLISASADPAARSKPLIVDNDRVMIKGVITTMIRPHRLAA